MNFSTHVIRAARDGKSIECGNIRYREDVGSKG